jgi:hypothetical protein
MVIEKVLEDPQHSKLEEGNALAFRNYIKSSDHRHPMIHVSIMFNIIGYIIQIQLK